MERTGNRQKRKCRFRCRRCCCIVLMKPTILLLLSLLLLNIAIGLTFSDPLLVKKMRRWANQYKYFIRPDHFRLLYERQCKGFVSAFKDPINRTLIDFAKMDTDEPRLISELDDLLDEKLRTAISIMIHKPRFSKAKAGFTLKLKMLDKNMRMSYDPQVMRRLLKNVKAHIDEHYQRLSSMIVDQEPVIRYKSCAVVGNSGEILNATRGPFIDSHDLVIRVNNAKSRNMGKRAADFVGSKTSLMFMNSHILRECSFKWRCFCHPYGSYVPIILYLCDLKHLLEVAICGSEHKAPLFVTDRRFDLFVTRISRWYSINQFVMSSSKPMASKWSTWERLDEWEEMHKHEFHYSSGMQAVVLALGLCEQVDLFGFGKNPNFKHHFHTYQMFEHYGHDFEAEYLFYDDLEAKRVSANPFLCEANTYIPPVHVYH